MLVLFCRKGKLPCFALFLVVDYISLAFVMVTLATGIEMRTHCYRSQ